MTPHEELQALLAQTAEHLRYYRELGITYVGESVPTAVTSEVVRPAVQAAPEPLLTLPKVKEAMSQPTNSDSLFGETAPLAQEQTVTDDSLEKIRADLGDCQRCKLWQTRTNIVFGEGNPHAELMFVGEAPGADEDASGRPFVGRAGQLLTKMIEAINFKREDVYIANILKSRPPDNRNPEADETKACIPFLYRQIAVVRPKPEAQHVIFHSYDTYTTNVPLDDFSADDVLLAWSWNRAPISREHGGPLRVVIPKLYFWKSAKWIKRIEFSVFDKPGFWEVRGYHNYGDPWLEQRYDEET